MKAFTEDRAAEPVTMVIASAGEDLELQVIAHASELLQQLPSNEVRIRVLRYLCSRFNIQYSAAQ